MLELLSSDTKLTGAGDGTATVDASWQGQSASLGFTVGGNRAMVSAITFTQPTRAYLVGLDDSTHGTQFTLAFDDGTTFPAVQAGSSVVGVPITSLLVFSSSDADYATVGASGTITLRDNTVGAQSVGITAESTANAGVAATKQLQGNLLPECSAYDGDLGTSTGGCKAISPGDEFRLTL